MSKELGTLVVVVLKAKNLHDRHSFYKQDPYAKITLDGKTKKTDVDVKGGQHPEWDAELRFDVYTSKKASARTLEVSCWRAESREHEEIGKGTVDISDTLEKHEFDDWVAIKDASGTYRGEVYLEMTFFPSGPPPLQRRPSKLPPQERLHHLKQSAPAAVGGKLAVPGGAPVHEPQQPKKDKPLPSVQELPGPAHFPPILRPGPGHGTSNGQGLLPSGHTPPINSPSPSSLLPGRPPTVPVQQPNNFNPPTIPGHHSRTSSGSGYGLSHPPPHPGHSPPWPSHLPPRQNSYVPDPPSRSETTNSGFFPSPHIVGDHTPPAQAPYSFLDSGSSYSPPRQSPLRYSPPQPPPLPISTGPPIFPSVSPQQSPPDFYPPRQNSFSYPPSQPNYSPPQSGYPPQPQPTWPPPPQPEYPVQTPPQFPPHHPTFPVQSTYATTYDNSFPPPGQGQRPFFGREDSIGEFSNPALAQRYSSPLPLPHDGKPQRSNSPFPVPNVPPLQHPVPTSFSPSAEYERELQRRREQEQRDQEYARRLDLELNVRESLSSS